MVRPVDNIDDFPWETDWYLDQLWEIIKDHPEICTCDDCLEYEILTQK